MIVCVCVCVRVCARVRVIMRARTHTPIGLCGAGGADGGRPFSSAKAPMAGQPGWNMACCRPVLHAPARHPLRPRLRPLEVQARGTAHLPTPVEIFVLSLSLASRPAAIRPAILAGTTSQLKWTWRVF